MKAIALCCLLPFVAQCAYSQTQPQSFSLLSDPTSRGHYGFSNDAFAIAPIVEWDDHDSFGLSAETGLSSHLLGYATMRAITSRRTDENSGSRIDDLRFGLKEWFPVYSGPVAEANVGLSLGFAVDGDFGLSGIQTGWHARAGIQRPVPLSYDRVQELSPTAGAIVKVARGGSLSPFVAAAAQAGFSSLDASVGMGLETGGLELCIGDDFRSCSSASAALKDMLNAERGPFYLVACERGPLRFSFDGHPLTGICNGFVGVHLGSPETKRTPDPAAGEDFGVLVGSTAAPSFRLWRKLLPVGSLSSVVFGGLSGGWIESQASGSSAPRASECALGIGLDATIVPWLSLRGGLESLISREELRSLSVQTSEVLDARTILSAGLFAEARIAFFSTGLGLGLKAGYAPCRWTLEKSQTSFASRDPMRAEVFVWSD